MLPLLTSFTSLFLTLLAERTHGNFALDGGDVVDAGTGDVDDQVESRAKVATRSGPAAVSFSSSSPSDSSSAAAAAAGAEAGAGGLRLRGKSAPRSGRPEEKEGDDEEEEEDWGEDDEEDEDGDVVEDAAMSAKMDELVKNVGQLVDDLAAARAQAIGVPLAVSRTPKGVTAPSAPAASAPASPTAAPAPAVAAAPAGSRARKQGKG